MSRHSTLSRKPGSGTYLLVALAILPVLAGCAQYRTFEIDAAKARRFNWNGKVRVTERVSEEMSLFAPRSKCTEISRIELVGDDGRSVVIRPIERLRNDKPTACVQDVGSPPDEYLVPLRGQIPEYEEAWRSMQERPQRREESQKAWDKAVAEYVRVNTHIQKREFEKVSGAQLAFACASQATQLESKYRLDERTIVRVSITEGSLLTVTVEDCDGRILHECAPTELAVVEMTDASR